MAESDHAGTRVGFNLCYSRLDGAQYAIYDRYCHTLDASEKIVVSGCAYALQEFDCPLEIALDLCNLLYEEALHLEAVGRFLGIAHHERPWIPVDKQVNWQLIRASEDLFAYLVTEHCLYEGRGTAASARGVFELRTAGACPQVLDVMEALCRQEAHHALTGFFWLKVLDDGSRDADLARVVARFLASEPLDDVASPRGRRQRFPLYLVDQFLQTRSYLAVRNTIIKASMTCVATGELSVTDRELSEAVDRVFAWCATPSRRRNFGESL